MLHAEWTTVQKHIVGAVFFTKLNTAISAAVPKARRKLISVRVVKDAESRRLNAQWRSKDYPTDVLSFAFDEGATVLVPREASIGDVIINVQQARRQADAHGHSLRREMAWLYVHGVLHILGYDHQKKNEERVMRKLEDKILGSAGYSI